MAWQLGPTGSRTQQKVSHFFLPLSLVSLIFAVSPLNHAKSVKNPTVSIMAYNVENLFDATDDGILQQDVTYLPMAIKKTWKVDQCLDKAGFFRLLCQQLDWTQEKYEQKLKNIAQVLLDYDSKGADIIVLEELENKRVITDLWNKHLKSKKYLVPIHFESPSSRGIDVGIISRFPLAEPAIAHHVDLSDLPDHPTRDIIEARFILPSGDELRIAANHWPSQMNTTTARLRAAKVVKEIAQTAQNDQVPFVATGDFNTLPQELPNPIANNIADNNLNRMTCPLVDIQEYSGTSTPFPPDSHFFKGSWSPLDRVLASKNLLTGNTSMALNLDSFEIFAPDYILMDVSYTDPQTGKKIVSKAPHRFDFMTGEGYSDHLPVAIKLNVNKLQNQ